MDDEDDDATLATLAMGSHDNKRRRMLFKPIPFRVSATEQNPRSLQVALFYDASTTTSSSSSDSSSPVHEEEPEVATVITPSPFTSVASLLSSPEASLSEDPSASSSSPSRPSSPSSIPPSPSSSPSPCNSSPSVSPTASPYRSRTEEDRHVLSLLSPLLEAIESEPYWRQLMNKKSARRRCNSASDELSEASTPVGTESEEQEIPSDSSSGGEEFEFGAEEEEEDEDDEEEYNNLEEDDEDYEACVSPCTPSRKRKADVDHHGKESASASHHSSSRSQTEALKAIYDEHLEQVYQRLLHNIRPTIGKREPTDLWQYAGLWRICKEVDSRQTGLFKSGTPVKSERRFPSRQNIYHWFVKMKIKKTQLFETFPRDTETLEYLKKRLVIDSVAYRHNQSTIIDKAPARH
jgi:hypothetical protein